MEILKVGGFQKIYEVSSFSNDFISLFQRSGKLTQYQSWLDKRLRFLDQDGIAAIDNDKFRKLDANIYEIRYAHSELNPRVLFTFVNGSIVLLLVPFLEKSKSDFKSQIQKAKNMLSQLERGNIQ